MRRKDYRGGAIVRTGLDEFDLVPRTLRDTYNWFVRSASDIDFSAVADERLMKWEGDPVFGSMAAGPMISTDQTMGGDEVPGSNDKIPTEWAVKQFLKLYFQGFDLQESVIDKDVNDPPADPDHWDGYIIGGAPTGDWSTHAYGLTYWDEQLDEWFFVTMDAGVLVLVEDEDPPYGAFYFWTGSVWRKLPNLYYEHIINTGDIDSTETVKAPTHAKVEKYGQIVTWNIGIYFSGLTITLKGINGLNLSATNPAYVIVPHADSDVSSNGKMQVIKVTANKSITLPPSVGGIFRTGAGTNESIELYLYAAKLNGAFEIGLSKAFDTEYPNSADATNHPQCYVSGGTIVEAVGAGTNLEFNLYHTAGAPVTTAGQRLRVIAKFSATTHATTVGAYQAIAFTNDPPFVGYDVHGHRAAKIAYDNATSGLAATDVKAAIDELKAGILAKDEASEIGFNNATSNLPGSPSNVQDAIDSHVVKAYDDAITAALVFG